MPIAGHQHFSFALYPHPGDWKQAMTVRHGYEFNYKLIATQVEQHTGPLPAEHSFAAVSADDVVLTAMKKAEDSNALVFHMYEWAGKSANLDVTVPRAPPVRWKPTCWKSRKARHSRSAAITSP